MASLTGPDLEDGRAAVEALMDDACIIYATSDEGETFDEVLGRTIVRLGDVIYDQTSAGAFGRSLADQEGHGGKCKLAPSSQDLSPSEEREGGELVPFRYYKFSIPLDGPQIPIGATIKVTSSRRDPRLIDRIFIVREPVTSTMAISQKMIVERRG